MFKSLKYGNVFGEDWSFLKCAQFCEISLAIFKLHFLSVHEICFNFLLWTRQIIQLIDSYKLF